MPAETVARYGSYKQPTAIKTSRLPPYLDILHIPDTEYSPLPSLQLSSESDTSKIHPSLKPIRKDSFSL